ncbi:GTPase 1 [Capsaspora owczarzaki ATCC 30864]|uniref:GTPase 1 n=1 Tax=Capsaspora owczarzaki (strain ATCC 30864) TaxID=595528 RepID=A0A0D2VPB5_CAPO3|nr:GTPase 1 [Capsaspora owczarzaki ATCC 30864]KJE92287.1 GTPase 1 [Capsaspora owczarzaki ATCC 30864]|eukprot:XP_004364127.1 GTPase 1 [Capsaspora owczarzaki ATCC 30864]
MAAAGFRTVFDVSGLARPNWFPGHMARGMREIARNLQHIDYVIEVHDARVPVSGRNPLLQALQKPSTLLLNKMDLGDPAVNKIAKARLHEINPRHNVVLTSATLRLERALTLVVDHILANVPAERADKDGEGIHAMIVGMPNVGKSSTINALRRLLTGEGARAKVGPIPGITRAVMQPLHISRDPKIMLIDTPGIMAPHIPNVEVGLKLAAVGTFIDHQVGEALIADYILFSLNLRRKFDYVKRYNMDQPCDDINVFLSALAQHSGLVLKGGLLNTTLAAARFIKDYREGALGRLTLDDAIVEGGLPAIVAAQTAQASSPKASEQARLPPLDEANWNPVDAFDRLRAEEKRLRGFKRRR